VKAKKAKFQLKRKHARKNLAKLEERYAKLLTAPWRQEAFLTQKSYPNCSSSTSTFDEASPHIGVTCFS